MMVGTNYLLPRKGAKFCHDVRPWEIVSLQRFASFLRLILRVSAVWFKIHEQGRTAAGKWAATDILNANNGTVTVTIPKNLKAGQYILRHELYVFALTIFAQF